MKTAKQLVNERLDRAAEVLDALKLDALVLSSGPNISYFTGAPLAPSDRLALAAISKSKAVKIICPAFERGRVEENKQLGVISSYEEQENPFETAGRAIAAFKADKIGIDPQMYFEFFDGLRKALPEANFVSGREAISRVRRFKSAEECDFIRTAGKITEDAIAATFAELKAGMTEIEIASEIVRRMKEGGSPAGSALVQIGKNAAIPHHHPDETKLADGDLVLFDCGCRSGEFLSDITRTAVFKGKPSEKMRKVYEIVRFAHESAYKKIKPGVPLEEFDRTARTAIYRAGFGPQFTHRLGHGLGIEGHEDPYIVEGNKFPAEPGMVFTVEPGIYIENEFGVRIEDDVLVTAKGFELLTGPARIKIE